MHLRFGSIWLFTHRPFFLIHRRTIVTLNCKGFSANSPCSRNLNRVVTRLCGRPSLAGRCATSFPRYLLYPHCPRSPRSFHLKALVHLPMMPDVPGREQAAQQTPPIQFTPLTPPTDRPSNSHAHLPSHQRPSPTPQRKSNRRARLRPT